MKTKYTKEDFEKAVMTSGSIREVLIKLGVAPKGGNYKVFYRNAKKFGVDVSDFINSSSYGIEKEKRACVTDMQIKEAVKLSTSFRSIILNFGLTESGSNNRWIKTKVTKLRLDISHFLGQAHLKGKTHNWSVRIPLEEILVENSEYTSSNYLRQRLIKQERLINECSICKITEWNNSKITLHLDHINGINTDNRIENLRLLCPNCHSQTETYCRKK